MSTPEEIAAMKKKRTFRKFQFRGVELDKLLDLSHEQLMEMVTCRARRRFSRGLKRKPMAFIKKLRAAKKAASFGEKPDGVKVLAIYSDKQRGSFLTGISFNIRSTDTFA
jgi:small subunit ribosomal protein S15e